jgi:hypothetical protein
VEECGPCPVFVSFTLAFALQLRKRHGKTSVRVNEYEILLITNPNIIPVKIFVIQEF